LFSEDKLVFELLAFLLGLIGLEASGGDAATGEGTVASLPIE
jgi:hypothetical protein